MPSTEYSRAEQAQLLCIARSSISEGVRTGRPISVDTRDLPAALQALRCTFVTLLRDGELRGCTGSMEPVQPLAVDVAMVACQTALSDPRFYPVQAEEISEINIEVSILSPLEALPVSSEADLLARLRPGIDGLVLELGPRRATFLPKVWETLPDPRDFVGELKRKAGLPRDFWSEEIVLHHYLTETFDDAAA
jgi:AmmeMemoRadiSam system protein A